MAFKTRETGYRQSVTTPDRQRRFATQKTQAADKDSYSARKAQQVAGLRSEAPRSGLLKRFRDFVLGPSLFKAASTVSKENVSRFNPKAYYAGESQLVGAATKRLEQGVKSKAAVPTDDELHDILNYVKKHG